MPASGTEGKTASADGGRAGRGGGRGSFQPPAVPTEGDPEVQTNSLSPTWLQDSKHQVIHSRLGEKGCAGSAGSGCKRRKVSGLSYQGLREATLADAKAAGREGLDGKRPGCVHSLKDNQRWPALIACRQSGLLADQTCPLVSPAPYPCDAKAEGTQSLSNLPPSHTCRGVTLSNLPLKGQGWGRCALASYCLLQAVRAEGRTQAPPF